MSNKNLCMFLVSRNGNDIIIWDWNNPMKKRELLPENHVNYVEDIIVKRDTENLRMSRKEVIQVI